ncbi:unnamed protein product [Echinostoma caproni]|uniref:CERK_C domain-containing protein n=1 Tax=Echinostoma caproni TaxID=27848 RepID=A0A183B2F6_9TREM|nr:unnamed protein product [Echinostoma caproni]
MDLSKPEPSDQPSWSLQGCPKGWKTIRGTFVAVNAFLISCRCSRAASGPSPWAHLGDGCIDLILIRECSRAKFLQFLVRTANVSVDMNNSSQSPFELPFVTVERVSAFKFRNSPASDTEMPVFDDSRAPCDEDSREAISPWSQTVDEKPKNKSSSGSGQSKRSIWCADGELLHHENISVHVHRQLLHIFARGLEPRRPNRDCPDQGSVQKHCNELFDAVVASAPSPSKSVYCIPMPDLVRTRSSNVIMISAAP